MLSLGLAKPDAAKGTGKAKAVAAAAVAAITSTDDAPSPPLGSLLGRVKIGALASGIKERESPETPDATNMCESAEVPVF